MTEETPFDYEPDILLIILRQVRQVAPGLSDEQLRTVEQSIRQQFGGMRFRLPKRKKHPTPAERRRIFADALTDATTEEITQAHGISRRTLYRHLKRGGE